MSVNIKLGNDIINGVNYLKVKNANNPNELITFAPTPFDLNIHYSSTTPPTDTSKLWVKTDNEPASIDITRDVVTGSMSNSVYYDLSVLGLSTSSVIRVGNYLYIVGGMGSGTRASASSFVRKFDIANKTYTSIGNLSEGKRDVCLGLVGTTIYVFGGEKYSQGASDGFTSKIEKIDTLTDTITTLTPTLYSNTDPKLCCATIGTNIYVFTYGNGYIFDSTNETVTQVISSNTNLQKSRKVCLAVDNNIYIYGGYTGSGSYIYYSGSIYKFNPSNNSLSLLTSLPMQSRNTLYFARGNYIYIAGGYGTTSDNTTKRSLNYIYKYDISNNSYEELTSTVSVTFENYTNTEVDSNNVIYFLADSMRIMSFNISLPLEEDKLLIADSGEKSFRIINDNSLNLTSYPSVVYIGDSNNEAQKVDAALYNSSTQTWENI